jgi:hypothetical protein
MCPLAARNLMAPSMRECSDWCTAGKLSLPGRDSEDLQGSSAGLGAQHDREATQGSKSLVVNGAGSAADRASWLPDASFSVGLVDLAPGRSCMTWCRVEVVGVGAASTLMRGHDDGYGTTDQDAEGDRHHRLHCGDQGRGAGAVAVE